MQHPISFGKFFIVQLHAGLSVSYTNTFTHTCKAWEKRREQKIDWNTSCLPLQCDMHDFGINIFLCVWVVSMLVLNHGSDDKNNGGFEVFHFFSFSTVVILLLRNIVMCAVQEMKSQDFLKRNWKKFWTIKKQVWLFI